MEKLPCAAMEAHGIKLKVICDTEAFPLQWPVGKPRYPHPQRSRFRCRFGASRTELLREIERLGGSGPIISTNNPVRRDGLPYASAREPNDCGVAVYFNYKGKQCCFACDRWDSTGSNVHAIYKTILVLRGIARWGSGDMMEQAFRGSLIHSSPATILAVAPGATPEEIRTAYLREMRKLHPDQGGSNHEMDRLNRRREALLKK